MPATRVSLAIKRDPRVPERSLMREPGGLCATEDVERLRRSEQENTELKAAIAELRRSFERFSVLRQALDLTGRIPRCLFE